jgi:hypothetical protein
MRPWLSFVTLALTLTLAVAGMVQSHRHDTEMDRLREHLRALEGISSSAPSAAPITNIYVTAPPSDSATANGAADHRSPGSAVSPAPFTVADRKESLEGAFVADSSSSDWGSAVQREARASLEAKLPSGSAIRSFDCRATLCRIETSHESVRTYNSFVHDAFVSRKPAPWSAPSYQVVLNDPDADDGRVTAVTFLARPGHEIPSF